MSEDISSCPVQPDLPTFRRWADQGLLVPVHRRIMADLLTPVTALMRIRRHGENAFLLESVEGGEKIARYSFLGCRPFLVARSQKEKTVLSYAGGRTEVHAGPFLPQLRRLFSAYRAAPMEGLPPFCGGAVGYLGYDLVRQFEDLPAQAPDDLGLDDAVLLFFRTLLAFDHVKQQIWILSCAPLPDLDHPDREMAYRNAIADIDSLEALLHIPAPEERTGPAPTGVSIPVEVGSNFSREEYERAVERAKESIRIGDIFQVVLAQRFHATYSAPALDLYRALRVVNPSPYMFYLQMEEAVIAGASPEMLVRVRGRGLEYRPIAGTRRRGATDQEDRQLIEDLLADPKERAEHAMLVDLGRNDLGRVAEFGTVRPRELFFIEKYSHVIHLVSSLEAELRSGLDRFDALAAVFPAGTVSGAPKIRAMEIIDELEPSRRGVYAGAVVYMDFAGNLDSCIAIRTMVLKNNIAYIQAGGGIVADSTPRGEYQESVNKSMALRRALELALNRFRWNHAS